MTTVANIKVSIFSTEDAVRQAAVDALKVRRERDYTDILVGGLHYPWPDVARRSAEAIVKLDRTDLIPQLVDFLDEPDPRAPVAKEVDQKKVFEARERFASIIIKTVSFVMRPRTRATWPPKP